MPRPKKQVLKQRSDGRYACRYKDRWFMGSTSDEALAAREEYKRAEIRGELAPTSTAPTVGQYVLTWLPLHKKGVSQKCYDDYAKQLDALAAVIGEKPLTDVSVDDAAAVWLHWSPFVPAVCTNWTRLMLETVPIFVLFAGEPIASLLGLKSRRLLPWVVFLGFLPYFAVCPPFLFPFLAAFRAEPSRFKRM